MLEELKNIATEIQNETKVFGNSHTKVGGLFLSILNNILASSQLVNSTGTDPQKIMNQSIVTQLISALNNQVNVINDTLVVDDLQTYIRVEDGFNGVYKFGVDATNANAAFLSYTDPDTQLTTTFHLSDKEFLASVMGKDTIVGLNKLFEKMAFNIASAKTLTDVGEVMYNSGTQTLELKMTNNVTLQVGQEMLRKVKNDSGVLIGNGKLVYVSGGLGANALVKLATTADADAAQRTFGMATEDITVGDTGFVTLMGDVNGVNTSGIAEGAELWLGTSGNYTTTEPTGATPKVYIGRCLRSHATAGVIGVNIRPIPRMHKLSGVSGTPTTTGQIYRYNATTSCFELYDLNLLATKEEVTQLGADLNQKSDQIILNFNGLNYSETSERLPSDTLTNADRYYNELKVWKTDVSGINCFAINVVNYIGKVLRISFTNTSISNDKSYFPWVFGTTIDYTGLITGCGEEAVAFNQTQNIISYVKVPDNAIYLKLFTTSIVNGDRYVYVCEEIKDKYDREIGNVNGDMLDINSQFVKFNNALETIDYSENVETEIGFNSSNWLEGYYDISFGPDPTKITEESLNNDSNRKSTPIYPISIDITPNLYIRDSSNNYINRLRCFLLDADYKILGNSVAMRGSTPYDISAFPTAKYYCLSVEATDIAGKECYVPKYNLVKSSIADAIKYPLNGKRIYLFGDSISSTLYSYYKLAFETLGATCINAGNAGWNIQQMCRKTNLQTVVDWNPDFVICLMGANNDGSQGQIGTFTGNIIGETQISTLPDINIEYSLENECTLNFSQCAAYIGLWLQANLMNFRNGLFKAQVWDGFDVSGEDFTNLNTDVHNIIYPTIGVTTEEECKTWLSNNSNGTYRIIVVDENGRYLTEDEKYAILASVIHPVTLFCTTLPENRTVDDQWKNKRKSDGIREVAHFLNIPLIDLACMCGTAMMHEGIFVNRIRLSDQGGIQYNFGTYFHDGLHPNKIMFERLSKIVTKTLEMYI
nr:DUF2190 family protein [uncultured Bacteroides sp.]